MRRYLWTGCTMLVALAAVGMLATAVLADDDDDERRDPPVRERLRRPGPRREGPPRRPRRETLREAPREVPPWARERGDDEAPRRGPPAWARGDDERPRRGRKALRDREDRPDRDRGDRSDRGRKGRRDDLRGPGPRRSWRPDGPVRGMRRGMRRGDRGWCPMMGPRGRGVGRPCPMMDRGRRAPGGRGGPAWMRGRGQGGGPAWMGRRRDLRGPGPRHEWRPDGPARGMRRGMRRGGWGRGREGQGDWLEPRPRGRRWL